MLFITEVTSRTSAAVFTVRRENAAVRKGYHDKVLQKIMIASSDGGF